MTITLNLKGRKAIKKNWKMINSLLAQGIQVKVVS